MEQAQVPAFKKGPWTSSEDEFLLNFVKEFGACNWNTAHLLYPALKRGGKSCRLRYVNQLRGGLRRDRVTPDEQRVIFMAYAREGNQWSKIAALWKRLKRQGLNIGRASRSNKRHAGGPSRQFFPGNAFTSHQCSWPTACASSAPAIGGTTSDFWGNYRQISQTQGSHSSLVSGNLQEKAAASAPMMSTPFVKENLDSLPGFPYGNNQLPSVQCTSKPLSGFSHSLAGDPPSFTPVQDTRNNDKDLLEAFQFSHGTSSTLPKCNSGLDNLDSYQFLLVGGNALLEEHLSGSSSSWSSNSSLQRIDQPYSPTSSPLDLLMNTLKLDELTADGSLGSVVLSTSKWSHMPAADSPVSVLNPHAHN